MASSESFGASQCYSSCREFVCQYEAPASNTLFAHDRLAIEIKEIVSGCFFKGFEGKMHSFKVFEGKRGAAGFVRCIERGKCQSILKNMKVHI